MRELLPEPEGPNKMILARFAWLKFLILERRSSQDFFMITSCREGGGGGGAGGLLWEMERLTSEGRGFWA